MTVEKKIPELKYFLFCDDIREELGGKFTLLGVYAGGELGVPPGSLSKGAAFAGVCLFAKFEGGVGRFKQKLQLTLPNGETLIIQGEDVTLEQGKVHLTNMIMKPFPAPSLGKYRVELFFDETPFEFWLEISERAPN